MCSFPASSRAPRLAAYSTPTATAGTPPLLLPKAMRERRRGRRRTRIPRHVLHPSHHPECLVLSADMCAVCQILCGPHGLASCGGAESEAAVNAICSAMQRMPQDLFPHLLTVSHCRSCAPPRWRDAQTHISGGSQELEGLADRDTHDRLSERDVKVRTAASNPKPQTLNPGAGGGEGAEARHAEGRRFTTLPKALCRLRRACTWPPWCATRMCGWPGGG